MENRRELPTYAELGLIPLQECGDRIFYASSNFEDDSYQKTNFYEGDKGLKFDNEAKVIFFVRSHETTQNVKRDMY